MEYIQMSGDEFVKKILNGETWFERVRLPAGFDLSSHDGFKEMNAYLKHRGRPFHSFDYSLYLNYTSMEGLIAKGIFFENTSGIEANLTGADLSGAHLGFSRFAHSTFKRVKLCSSDIRSIDFSCADLEEGDISGAEVYLSNFFNADIRHLKGLETCRHLEDAKFEKTKVSAKEREIILDVLVKKLFLNA